jgi:phosphoribosylamine--glycine ligase
MKRALIIGSGGREHAIIYKIKQSKLVSDIFCISGNAGISQICQCIDDISINDHEKIVNFCQENMVDLVIIGPEQPLIAGLSDDLRKANINVFGPSKLAARLEGSKIFTKEICDKYNIPTAKYKKFNNEKEAFLYLNNQEFPLVIKADGIAAGKGVIIAQNINEAQRAITEILGGKFGLAGNNIIIEDFLSGPEISFFAICDGKKAKFFGSAGDHKKVGENETGLNTGGMGTYSPSPFLSESLHKEIMDNIINPTLKGMEELGCPFSGILFAGLILTKNGPKLLEFNTRLGDPETQTILLRLESDLFQIMEESAQGNLKQEIKFSDKKAVCVVLAANGYPESYQKGSEIKNLKEAENISKNISIFHAGTKFENNKILANGGRVLGVSALGDDFKEARDLSYNAIAKIDWKEGFYRKDIAAKII